MRIFAEGYQAEFPAAGKRGFVRGPIAGFRAFMIKTLPLALIFLSIPTAAQTVTVNWNKTYQTMAGWGGQTWISANSITDAQADLLFSPTTGIGLEYVRTMNTEDGSIPDLVTLQKAVARGARVEITLQSPPSSMKTNGHFYTGGSLKKSDYGAYVAYIVNLLDTLRSDGVPVDVLSVQGEPDSARANGVGACLWNAGQYRKFVRDYLGPAFASKAITTKIMLGESENWFDDDYVSATLKDHNAAGYVSIIAGHGYGTGTVDGTGVSYCCHTATAFPLALRERKTLWMTEINGGFTKRTTGDTNMWVWDPSMSDALVWAHNIHDYLTVAGVSAWFYWELASNSAKNYNDGYTDHNFNPGKRYYAIGNFSRYVRYGYQRIDATSNPAKGVSVTAFKDPLTSKFAVVAVNQNSSPVTLTLSLTGFSSSSVVPVVTDPDNNLAEQAPIPVSAGRFTATLSPSSVTTLTGNASAGVTNSMLRNE
jgi:glucuronoarabinoxylan endo-1,4-beta-xylanase